VSHSARGNDASRKNAVDVQQQQQQQQLVERVSVAMSE